MARRISPPKVPDFAIHQQTQCHSGGLFYPWSYLENHRNRQLNTLAWSCTTSLAGRSTSAAHSVKQMSHALSSREVCEHALEFSATLHL